MKCTGEEAVACRREALVLADDMCFPTYRQQGLLIARGWSAGRHDVPDLFERGDRIKGRQLPIMYSAKEAGFFSISGNLGTQYPQAVGWAMASADKGDDTDRGRLDRRRGDRGGRFPLRLHLRQRLSRAGDPQHRQQPVGDLAASRHSRGRVDHLRGARRRLRPRRRCGWTVTTSLAVYAATEWAAERARTNLGATVIEHFTYRAEPAFDLRRPRPLSPG